MQGTLDVTPYLASPMAIGWLEENYGWARARATMTANADAAADAVAEAVAPYLDGVGFVRLSVHLYTTAADIDAFNDRAVPLLVEWSREPGAGRPAKSPTI